MKGTIRVETQSKEPGVKNIKLTSCQWKVYFKLMSISKYNAKAVEDHRYVYRNSFVMKHLCDEIGIKSTNTFKTAIKKLEQAGLLLNCEEEGYYLLYVKNWTEIRIDILSKLVDWSKCKESEIDLLRTFLILKAINDVAENDRDRSFTLFDICCLLLHNVNTTQEYVRIRYYLALLSSWGLIELKTHTNKKPGIRPYTVFHIQKINETNLSEDFYSDIQSEMNKTEISKEMMEKLKFTCPELVGDIEEY